jgi:hypothetical protein
MVLWFTSESVRKFVLSIPFRIAGIDPYENAPVKEFIHSNTTNTSSPVETFIGAQPFTKPGDVVENLGFLKGLIELPKAFILLPQFLVTIIKFFKILTKPFAIFRLVIGLIIGIGILILYIIVTIVASIIFIIPATIKVVFFKILATVLWIAIYAITAFVYVMIIFVINPFVGNSLTSVLRCENLPNAWLKYTNFMFGNKYERRFFCNGTCSSKFLSTANWCNATEKPSQCPQQVIYNLFHESFWRNTKTPKVKELNSVYNFKPNLKYMGLKSEEREKILRAHLREKYSYLKDCYKQSASWEPLTQANKRWNRKETHPINDDLFNRSSLSVCEFVGKYESKLPPKVVEELKYLCTETFCRQTYNTIYRSKGSKDFEIDLTIKPKYNFCPSTIKDETQKEYAEIIKQPINALNGFITVSIGLILIGILFAIFINVKPGNT